MHWDTKIEQKPDCLFMTVYVKIAIIIPLQYWIHRKIEKNQSSECCSQLIVCSHVFKDSRLRSIICDNIRIKYRMLFTTVTGVNLKHYKQLLLVSIIHYNFKQTLTLLFVYCSRPTHTHLLIHLFFHSFQSSLLLIGVKIALKNNKKAASFFLHEKASDSSLKTLYDTYIASMSFETLTKTVAEVKND
jgi:hypothetical protein